MSPPPFGHRGLVGSAKDLGYCGIEPCRPAPSGSRLARLNSSLPHSFRLIGWWQQPPHSVVFTDRALCTCGIPLLVAGRSSPRRVVALSRLVGRGRCASSPPVCDAGFLPNSSRAASLAHAQREPWFPLCVGLSFARSLRSQRAIGARIFYYSSATCSASHVRCHHWKCSLNQLTRFLTHGIVWLVLSLNLGRSGVCCVAVVSLSVSPIRRVVNHFTQFFERSDWLLTQHFLIWVLLARPLRVCPMRQGRLSA